MTALFLELDPAAVATAHIPEPFLDALRSGHPSEVTISGLAVMVVPSRAGGVDPDVEVQAWDRVRDLHYEISADVCTEGVPAGRVERAVDLPEQIAAIGWEQGVHEIVCVLGEPARPRIRHLQVVTSC